MKKIVATALLLLPLVGCQSVQTKQKPVITHKKDTIELSTTSSLIIQNPWYYVQNQLNINIPENKRIQQEKQKILKNRKSFESNLLRSEPYIYYIVKQLKERNMPVELALIPLIESSYNQRATSYAKAAGLWQIVPITAKEYGLEQNSYYDPRRDFIQSTDTAINLLQYLNQRFDGDWLLTLAAYNAGENRVKKAIKWNQSKGLPTNFWALNLSKQTMQYVPKFIALIDIIKHSDTYELSLPTCEYENSLVRVDLNKQVSLEKIAQYSGISMDELLEYNAAYLKKVIKGNSYHLFIPSVYANALMIELKKSNAIQPKITDLMHLNTETGPIASSFDATAFTNNKYVKINDIDIHFYEKEHLRYSQIIYLVKHGDNLYKIAKNYNVKVSELIKWNKITKINQLKPGDKLTINIDNSKL